MKKVLFLAAFVASTGMALSSGTQTKSDGTGEGGKVTLINDTDEKVSVHTGSGSVTLNPNGGKTSFSCDTGKKVKVNGSVIFTNNSDHCDETVKLSDYM